MLLLTIIYVQFIGVYVIISTRNFTLAASLVQPLLSGNRKLKAQIHPTVLLLLFSVQECVFNYNTALLKDLSCIKWQECWPNFRSSHSSLARIIVCEEISKIIQPHKFSWKFVEWFKRFYQHVWMDGHLKTYNNDHSDIISVYFLKSIRNEVWINFGKMFDLKDYGKITLFEPDISKLIYLKKTFFLVAGGPPGYPMLLLLILQLSFVSADRELARFQVHAPCGNNSKSANCPPYCSELCVTITFIALLLPGKNRWNLYLMEKADGRFQFVRHLLFLSIYGSTALVDLGRFFSFVIYTQSVGFLGRGISPSQARYLHTEHKRHPCLRTRGHLSFQYILIHNQSPYEQITVQRQNNTSKWSCLFNKRRL
jgi:hypothetical protein